MKELRRNIRIIGELMLAGILVLVVYLNYTVALNGNRWTNSTNNTRLTTARKYVIAGDIIRVRTAGAVGQHIRPVHPVDNRRRTARLRRTSDDRRKPVRVYRRRVP